MTHFLFTLWDGAGALPPELSVARALVERGHRVSVLSDPTAEAEALAAGADFRPWREAPHVQVVRSAPHSAVLEQAAAVVTHGGHGTVLRSLAAGVPALVLPMGRDQLDNAARVVQRGAGLRLKPSAKPSAIAAAVQRLLDEPGHREGARGMAGALRAEAGRDEAADELEGAQAGTGGAGRASSDGTSAIIAM